MANVVESKIISPTVEQQLKAIGTAQVIVVLRQQTIGLAIEAPDAVAGRLAHLFSTSERSQTSALLKASAADVGASVDTAPPAVRVYSNLGVMLGTVDRLGLDALQASDDVEQIAGAPAISLIRPDRVAPSALTANTTWAMDRLRVPALWNAGLTGKGVRIGHLDTGADGSHPALRHAIGAFANFDLLGRRVTPDGDPYDSSEHGTHTAAIIAGRPVRGKHIGIAHGAVLYCALVIEGGDTVARVLAGLDWALESGVKIISMSLGFRGWWEDFIPIIGIVRARDVLPVIAIGNEGPGTSRSPGNYPETLSVGAIDRTSRVAPFSSSQSFNRAGDPIVPDVVAPGVEIISARPGNRYQMMSGTSMATPHVAALAALLWEASADATAKQIEQAIYTSCSIGALPQDRANRGVPDAVAALEALKDLVGGGRTGVGSPAPARRQPRAKGKSKKRVR